MKLDAPATADITETPGLPARQLATTVLLAILEHGQPLDESFDRAPGLNALEIRDRAFARALITTTLRRLGRIDATLDAFLREPLGPKAKTARVVLRLGVAQLLFLDTPPHAAVSAMVALAEADPQTRPYKKLINAVLRRAADQGRAVITELGPRDDWPAWLVESWRTAYGPERAAALAHASGMRAPLDLTLRADLVEHAEDWAQKLGAERVGRTTLRVAEGADITALEGFEAGAWWVQDAAAALPAEIVLTALAGRDGARVLDLCAAPGGKALQLASAGAQVTAVDRAKSRLKKLHANLERTRLSADVRAMDGRDAATLARETGAFDAVLVDAPCSATGTLRRRPDVAHHKTPDDVASLAQVQAALIAAAAQAVTPGGTVVFCTCSLQPEEGAGALHAGLKAAAELGAPLTLGAIDAAALGVDLPSWAEPQPDGALRTFPSTDASRGGDGFFMAKLTRAQA